MNIDQANVMFKNMLLAEQAQVSTLKTQHIALLQGQEQQPASHMPGAAQGMASALKTLASERNAALQALQEAQELVKDWQSAMEAWRDLAQTLRDEIKACPNHDAHKFGQNKEATDHQRRNKEDATRVSKGLSLKYTPAEKGKI